MKAFALLAAPLMAISTSLAWAHEGHGAESGFVHDLMHLSWTLAVVLVAASFIFTFGMKRKRTRTTERVKGNE